MTYHDPELEHPTPIVTVSEEGDQLDRLWDDPPGLIGQLKAVQNDAIGRRLMLTGFFFLILGGTVDSLAMRLQLAIPENQLIGPQLYNELFTNHGSVTMFLVILPIFEGFAIMVLPAMLGSREMPFPRLGAFAYWTFLLGGLLYYSSTLFSAVPDAGWFGYTPLSGPEFSPDLALDFWVLGLGVAEIGAIAAAVEIIIAILKLRTPGMSLGRIPLLAWAYLVTAFMILFAFTPLIVGSLLLELDRGFGTQFFNPEAGGSSLLWQHLFWIFGHPEVYIQFIPATGIVSTVIPVFARRRIVGYPWIVAALVATGFLSFGLWAHHMFTVGISPMVLSFFSAASMVIAIPAGVQIFAWIATIWEGRPVFRTPSLFAIGFLVLFVLGGITGVMVASVPFDVAAHDSYFVVAHLHYVLIGGVGFPIFAGVYYWFPKFTGRMLDERLGRWNFWLMFIGVNVTFFPMHFLGLRGMPRRIYTYPDGIGWGLLNLISTIGAFVIAAGIGIFVVNVVRGYRGGALVGHNPWGADTLEWAMSSPPPPQGYSVPPIVTSRHPLWDQTDLHDAGPELENFVEAFGNWPSRWRGALITDLTSGQPREVFLVNGPSLWPLVVAVGTVSIFIAELFKFRLAAAIGAVVMVIGVIGWNWPWDPPITEDEEQAFETDHGVPVYTGGSPTLARWGMGVMMLFLAIAFGAFLLGYFYLRLGTNTWPPPGLPDPSWPVAVKSSLAVLAGSIAAWMGVRAIRRGDQNGLRLAFLATLVFGFLAAYVQITDMADLDFSWTDNAYGSIFVSVAGFGVAILSAGMLISALILWWALAGRYTKRRHVTVVTAARYWTVMPILWTIGAVVIYGTPHLT